LRVELWVIRIERWQFVRIELGQRFFWKLEGFAIGAGLRKDFHEFVEIRLIQPRRLAAIFLIALEILLLLGQIDDPIAKFLVVHESLDRGIHLFLGCLGILILEQAAKEILELVCLAIFLAEFRQILSDLVGCEVAFPERVSTGAGIARVLAERLAHCPLG
jgi:hypothetical protein